MSKKEDIIINLLKIIRPYQWVKNTLVFLPMIMAHDLNLRNFFSSGVCFVIFSLVASSIYVINDISDKDSDIKHPYKKNRPYAAGLIKIDHCIYLVISLLIICLLLLINTNKNFIILIIIYFTISNVYTFFLKKIIFIDLLILSSLYTLRIIGGGLISDIDVSFWLIFFSLLFFGSLATIKRLIEVLNTKQSKGKKIFGRGYSKENKKILNIISITSGVISILVLIFYTNSSQIINMYSSPNILWLINFIMFFWIMRIIVFSNQKIIKDDPIMFAIKDLTTFICLFSILCIMFIATIS